VRRAGAIYWANSIANTIKAADAAAFDAALGETLCVLALANRDLSGPMQPLTPYDRLGARVMEDGLRCLGAWCKAQCPGVGLRVRLKLAPNPALDDAVNRPFDEFGPAIVRRTVG
jgi:coenzyme F420-reducing hydrogenase gamma subunit